jgi:hypothetical protein
MRGPRIRIAVMSSVGAIVWTVITLDAARLRDESRVGVAAFPRHARPESASRTVCSFLRGLVPPSIVRRASRIREGDAGRRRAETMERIGRALHTQLR